MDESSKINQEREYYDCVPTNSWVEKEFGEISVTNQWVGEKYRLELDLSENTPPTYIVYVSIYDEKCSICTIEVSLDFFIKCVYLHSKKQQKEVYKLLYDLYKKSIG